MATDPGTQKLSEISTLLEDLNDKAGIEANLKKNELLLEQTLNKKNSKLSEDQLDALRKTQSLLKSDKLQTIEDKREADKQLRRQLELLGIIADKDALQSKDQSVIGKIIGAVIAPLGFTLGTIVGVKDSVMRLMNVFDIKLNKPLADAVTKLRVGFTRIFSVPSIFLADNVARLIDIFDFDNLGVNKISQELLDKTFESRMKVRQFFLPVTQLKEAIKLFGGAFIAVLKDFRANFIAGLTNQVGARVITTYTDDFLKSIRGFLMMAGAPFTKVDFRFKDFNFLKRILKFADGLGDFIRPFARFINGFTKLFLLPLTFFSKIFLSEADDIVRGIKGTKDGVAGVSKTFGNISKTFKPIIDTAKNIFKAAFKIGQSLGRFFIPLAAAIAIFDTIRGAIEGFNNETGSLFRKIISGWFGAVKGLVNSVLGGLLDLIIDGVGLLLGWFGMDDWKQALLDFSFQDQIITPLFDGMKNAIFAILDFFKSGMEMAGNLFTSGFDIVNNFIKALLQSVLPDPDSENLIPRLASKAIPSFVYEYAGMDPDTGDVIEKFESRGVDALGKVAQYSPLGLAAQGAQMLNQRINNNNSSSHNYYTADPTEQVGNALNSPV